MSDGPTLRDQLEAIRKDHGELTAEAVVLAATPKDHPLHTRVFDRPSKEAASAWYLHQARELIQSVKVVYREADEEGPAREVRAFHAIARRYEPVEKIAQDPVAREILLAQMEREWEQFQGRYEHFREFAEMIAASLAAK